MAQPQAPSVQSGSKAATIIAVILLLLGAAAAWFLTKSGKPFGPVLKDPLVYAVPAAELLLYIVLIGLWGRGASFKSSVGALLFAIVWRAAMAGAAAGLNKSVPISEGFATVYLRAVIPVAVTIALNIIALAIIRRRFFPKEVAPAAPAESYAPPAAAPPPAVEAVSPTPPEAPEAAAPEVPVTEEEAPPPVEPETAEAIQAEPAEAETGTEDALAGALAALAAQEAAEPEEEQKEETPSPFAQTLTVPEQEAGPLPSPPAEAAEEAPLFTEEGAAEEEALFAPPEVEETEAKEETAFTFEVAPEEPAPLTEQEAPVPEAPAPVAEEAAPQEAPAGAVAEGEAIRVSAESILSQFPPDALAMDAEAIQQQLDNGVFRIPVDEVLPQLSEGEVRVPASLVIGQMPPGALAVSEADLSEQVPDGLIELPLEEIVPQISPAMLTRTDQVVEEFDLGEEPLFQFEIEEGEQAAPVAGETEEAAPEPEAAVEEQASVEQVAEEEAKPLFQPFAEEAPTPAAEEPQAEAVTAVPPTAPSVERVRVHAESILAQFPSDALGMAPDEIAATLPDGCFEVDASHVLPQLGEGQVRVPLSIIVAQLPSHALVKSEQELLEAMPDGNVELPLEEVVPQLTSVMTSQAEEAPEEEIEELSAPLFSFEVEPAAPEEVAEEPSEAEEEAPLFAPAEEAPVPEEEAPEEEEVPLFAPAAEAAEAEEPTEAEEEAPLFAPAEEAPAPEEEAPEEEEVPLFAPAAEAAEVEEPAEAEAPVEAEVSVPGKVSVSAEAILSQIPTDVLAMEPSRIIAQLEHGVFLVDEKLVLGQLTAGEIRVDADVIAEQIPEAALTIPLATLVNELPDGTFELPLGEVVPQVKEHIVEAAPSKAEEAAEFIEEPLFEQPSAPAAVEEKPEPAAAPAAEEHRVAEEEAPELVEFVFEEIGLSASDRERIADMERSGVLERIPAGLAQIAPERLEPSYFVAPHGARVALLAPATADAQAARDNVGNLLTHVQRLSWALNAGDVTAILLQAENGALLAYGAAGPEGLTMNVCVEALEGTNLGKAELLAKRALSALKDFDWSETPFIELEPWDRSADFSVQEMTAEAQAATVSLTRSHKPMGAMQAKLFGRADGRKVITFVARSVTARLSAAGSDIADAAIQCAQAVGLGAAARIVICTTDTAIGVAVLDCKTRRAVLCAGAEEPLRPAKAAVELEDAAEALSGIRW